MQLFVRPAAEGSLAVNNRRFLIVGFSAPPHALEMAASGVDGRNKVGRSSQHILPRECGQWMLVPLSHMLQQLLEKIQAIYNLRLKSSTQSSLIFLPLDCCSPPGTQLIIEPSERAFL